MLAWCRGICVSAVAGEKLQENWISSGPSPVSRNRSPRFYPNMNGILFPCCFCNCKSPAQIFNVQISCLWVQGCVLSNESCESFPRIRVCHEFWNNQVYPMELDGPHRRLFSRSCHLLSVYWISGTVLYSVPIHR